MLKPILPHKKTFTADIANKNSTSKEYVDPLMKWPMRGAAFTNELGEALRPVIGNCANLAWVPALLYIGADVYDKYKNNETEYSPNSKRCLKQAIFQGLASILLPIFAIKAGQKSFSLFGLATKDNLSYTAKEQIIDLAQQFVANGKIKAHYNKDDECIKEFVEIVKNNIDYKTQEGVINNPLKKLTNKFKIDTNDKLDAYAEKIMKDLIETRKNILSLSESTNVDLLKENYQSALNAGKTKGVALRSTLVQYLNTKTLKGRVIKIIGGFVALGLAIKPIDKFVEHIIIGKVIGPGIDKTKKLA